MAMLLAVGLSGSQIAHAATYDDAMKNANYVVMSGDVNGDGQIDLLFKAKPKIVLIPLDDDVSIPLTLPPLSPSFALVSISFGNYTLNANPDAATLASAAWKPATQQITFSGSDGVYADTVSIGAVSDTQASFKVGISGSGSLALISTVPPVNDPTLPPAVSPVYAMSDYMKGAQDFTLFTKAPNGDRLLVWTKDDDSKSAMLKRWDAAGNVLGPTEHMALGTNVVSVSANKVGNFTVLRKVPDGGFTALRAAVYSRAGQQTATMQVNPMYPQLSYPNGLVTMYNDGSFASVYLTSTETVPSKLWFNRFQADGTPINQFGRDVGYQTQINALASDQTVDGGLTVMSYFTPASNGVAYGASPHIRSVWSTNLFSAPIDVGQQYREHLAMNGNGTHVTAWSEGAVTYARKYSAAGTAGPALRISSQTVSSIGTPKVVVFGNNSYAVTWPEDINGVFSLKTRLVDQNDMLAGAEKLVATGFSREVPFGASADPSGSYTVAWLKEGTDANGKVTKDVLMRDYAAGTTSTIWPLTNAVAATNLSGAVNTIKYYKIVVPANKATLKIVTSSQASRVVGNADLYVSYAQMPTYDLHDIRSGNVGNEEAIQISSPPPGAYYIAIFGTEAYESVSLSATFE